MQAKLDQVRRLLREGYVLDEVESERGAVEARLRRGALSVTIRFLPSEAEALLLMRGPLGLER